MKPHLLTDNGMFIRAALTCVFSLLVLASPAFAWQSEQIKPIEPATTIANAEVSLDRLHVLIRPMTKDELATELGGWLSLLRSKIREVGEIELQIQTNALQGNDLDVEIPKLLLGLRKEETAISERTQIILEGLKDKGGDVEEAQAFIDSVSSLGETTDATSFWAALVASATSWFKADDGGKLLRKRLLMAAFTLFVFWLISKFAGRITAKTMSRHLRVSNLLEDFARRTAGGVVFVVGVLMSLAVMGVQIGPLMAALGAGGFILGFALQETLGSFASGLMIMIYRPFDIGHFVAIAGEKGTVKEMSLVSTKLTTPDNKIIVIPNQKAWGDTIVNFTSEGTRRIDLVFGIGYDDDIRKATELLNVIASSHPLVLKDPELTVNISELADSSVNLFCRPWVKTADYWAVKADITRAVKSRFDAAGISFPFPQRDVHIYNEK